MCMSRVCPKAEKCPIFTGVLKDTGYSGTYRSLYCENGEEGRLNCRRFQVASKVGECPPNLLPNSVKSVEDIIHEMQEQGLIPN